MTLRTTVLLAVLAAVLALPGIASGAVRCVPAAGPGCASAHLTIGGAVTAAVDDDEIRIAAGVYPESIATTKRLNFVGAGSGTLDSAAGATEIAPPSGTAIALQRGGSLRSLRVVGPTGPSGGNAVTLVPDVDGTFAYAVTDVIGLGGNATDVGIFGIPGIGLQAASLGTARVMNVTVTGGAFRGGSAPAVSTFGATVFGASTTMSLTGTSLLGASTISTALNVSAATVEATGVTARAQTAAVVGDASVAFRRSRLEGSAQGLVVTDFSGGSATAVSVTDSLVSVEPVAPVDAIAIIAQTFSGSSPLTVPVHGSTIVAGGEDPLYAVAARPQPGGPNATIQLRNSIARLTGPAEAGEADVAADRGTVIAANSSFATRAELNGGTATAPGSGTNLIADPLFTPGSFTLQSSSPLIDRGDPTIVTPGELDLAGNPRLAGAAPDIGAFELQPPVAPPPPPQPPQPPGNERPALARVAMTNKVFAPAGASAAARKRKVKRGTTFRYSLSEAATVTLVIERKARGGRARGRCGKPAPKRRPCTRWLRAVTLRAAEQSGSQSEFFSGRVRGRPLAPGRYRARIRAKDALGAASAERRLTFRVVRAP